MCYCCSEKVVRISMILLGALIVVSFEAQPYAHLSSSRGISITQLGLLIVNL